MLALLFALFLGIFVVFQTTGTLNSMAEDNVQLAVDLQNAANSMNLTSLLPVVIAVIAIVAALAIGSITQSFAAAHGK